MAHSKAPKHSSKAKYSAQNFDNDELWMPQAQSYYGGARHSNVDPMDTDVAESRIESMTKALATRSEMAPWDSQHNDMPADSPMRGIKAKRASRVSDQRYIPVGTIDTSMHEMKTNKSPWEVTLEYLEKKPLPKLPKRGQFKVFFDKKINHADQPPDGGKSAWLQVLAGFLITANGWGMAAAFGVYQAYYEAYMLKGHSSTTISWIGTIQASLTLLVGILSGPLFDKGYFFQVLVIGSIGMVGAYVSLSFTHNYWQVMLCQGVLAGIASGLLYIPSISIIPMYFTTKRGTAIGLVTAGAPFGGIIYPIAFKNLLQRHDFAIATRVISGVIFVLLAISVLLIKPLIIPNRPKKAKDPSMFRDKYFVTFVIAGFFAFLTILTPYILSAEYFFTEISPDLDAAFYALVIINAANLVGRATLGYMSDHLPFIGAESLILATQGCLSVLGFAWIAVGHSRAGYYSFLVLWGYFSAGIAVLPAASIVHLCPSLDVFATRLGVSYAFAGVGVLIGTPIATAVRAGRADYLGTQVWIGVANAVSVGLVWHCGREIRRKRLAAAAKASGRGYTEMQNAA